MDVISYSYADEQKKKIDKFIADPKNSDGIVTVPKTIHAGNDVIIPTDRQVVARSFTIESGASVTLEGTGEIFIPSGGVGVSLPVVTTDSVKTQTTQKTIPTDNLVKQVGGVVQDIDGNKIAISPAGDTMTGNLEAPSMSIGGDFLSVHSFKNKLINGSFDIWQRGTSFIGSKYTADRWIASTNVSVSKFSYTTAEKRGYNQAQITFASGGYSFFEQKIEDGARLIGGRTFTFTIVFEQILSTVHDLNVVIADSSGAYASNSVSLSPTAYSTVTGTLTVNSLSAKTAGDHASFRIYSSGGTDGSYRIMSIQLEEGSVATPFEQRPIGLELSLCQRYYWKYAQSSIYMHPIYNSTTNLGRRCSVYFPQEMRVNPTVTNITAGGLSDTPTLGATRTRIAIILGTASTATSYTNLLTVDFDSEL